MREHSKAFRFKSMLGAAGAALLAASTWTLAPIPGLGTHAAEAARASTSKSVRKGSKQRRVVTRPPVRVDPQARNSSAAQGKLRRGSGTPPPPYSGNPVRPRVDDWDFGPGTVVQRRDQLRPPQPKPPLRPLRPPRGYDPVPGPGHGPGTYITPIYPGTIGPTGN